MSDQNPFKNIEAPRPVTHYMRSTGNKLQMTVTLPKCNFGKRRKGIMDNRIKQCHFLLNLHKPSLNCV